ncbi:MAG: hypothetical protein ACE5EM_04305 [Sphingomonadales bacterium]
MAIINLDFSLVANFLNAQTALRNGTAVPALLAGPPQAPNRGPAVIAPWELAADDRVLEAKIAGLRRKDKFIDLKADSVVKSRGDEDSKKLFALFNALNDLRTIAEFAASENTTSGLFKSLDATLQRGLTEIRGFVADTTFVKPLDLVFGTKKDHVVSQAALGRSKTEYVGSAIQVGARDDPIANLTGAEKFTISITKGATTDNIVVDLALMTDPLSISNIGKFINDQITAIQELDSNNNLVPKFATRFNTQEVAKGQFALKIKTNASEQISLSAADVTPSVVLTGTKEIPGVDSVETSFVNKLNDVSGVTPSFGFSREVASALPGEEPKIVEIDGKGLAAGTEIETIPLAETEARAVATDSEGNIFVIGGTAGDVDSHFNRSDGKDVFLYKYDSAGNVLFRRLLGADAQAEGFSVAIDSKDNVIVAGKSTDNLTATAVVDNPDSFVTKFDKAGKELFTYQVQSGSTDGAAAVSIDANDDILIAGFVDGKIDSAQTAAGGRDAFLTKLDGTKGTVTATHQFGTAGTDTAAGIAIAADGNILVASNENGRAILRKFNATTPSTAIFSVDIGALNGGDVTGLAVDGAAVYLSGFTSNATLGGTIVDPHSGGTDGFVTRINDAGASASVGYTSFVGSSADDRIRAVTVNNGDVFVGGHTTGSLPGETLSGKMDGFVAKFNGTTGVRQFVDQFGAPSSNFDVNGIAFTAQGSSSLSALGLPGGKIDTSTDRSIIQQTSVRDGDQFFIQINGGAKRKITIEAGDSFITLANKIDRLSFLNITARSSFSKNGPQIRIEGQRGATIDILAGPKGKDALKGLGILPTRLFDEVSTTDEEEDIISQIGGIFGLELDRGLNLRSQKGAEFSAGALDLAAGIAQRAFRSLTFDPEKERLKKLLETKKGSFGPPPQHLANQLANLQAGLARLNSSTPTTFGFF